MTHSTLITLSRRALQVTALFLAAAPVTFGSEPVTPPSEGELIGHVTVSAARERQLIGHIVVTSGRLAPANVAIADLGAMTVTARRETALAYSDRSQAEQVSL